MIKEGIFEVMREFAFVWSYMIKGPPAAEEEEEEVEEEAWLCMQGGGGGGATESSFDSRSPN